MNKYETLYSQSEQIDTDEAYNERDKIYKSMSYEEILNLINEIDEISILIATNTNEFNLDTIEISSIGSRLKDLNKTADCISTIAYLRRIRNK